MAHSNRGSSTVQPKVHKVCFIREKKGVTPLNQSNAGEFSRGSDVIQTSEQ